MQPLAWVDDINLRVSPDPCTRLVGFINPHRGTQDEYVPGDTTVVTL